MRSSRALKQDGFLSVTEVLPVPHYQSQSAVRHLAKLCGYRVEEAFGTALTYTLNLEKKPTMFSAE